MGRCKCCGAFVLFGGKKAGGKRYCNANCAASGMIDDVVQQVPEELVDDRVKQIHAGVCPVCQGPGPVDVHASWRVISILVATRWSTRFVTGCRSCGNRQRLGDAIYCFILGWWGVPYGLFATPTNIVRNLWGMAHGPDPSQPSPLLRETVRRMLASEAMAPDETGDDAGEGDDRGGTEAPSASRHLVSR